MDVRVAPWRKLSAKESMLLDCDVGQDSWEPLEQQGDPISQSQRKSTLNMHLKDWCWSWNSNALATWCKEPTHWKKPWCWERLRAEGEEGDRGWDGWMASLTQWTWVWENSGSWWWTGKPGILQSTGSQRLRGWTELNPQHIQGMGANLLKVRNKPCKKLRGCGESSVNLYMVSRNPNTE